MYKTLTLVIMIFLLASCSGGGGDSACSAIGRVAGGDSCSDGQANVALIISFDQNGNVIGQCTGSYISLTSVLTAAHCFPRSTRGVGVASKGNLRNATSLAVHPLYNGSVNSPFDMAILKVDAPLSGSGPLPLLLSRNPTEGEEVVAYGYGHDESGRDFLERVNAGDAVLKATFTTFGGYSSGTSLIVSTGEGLTCPGDSGGPVVAANNAGQYGIIGITRSGPEGCSAEKGRPSYLSSTQSNGALDFITRVVPDVATN